MEKEATNLLDCYVLKPKVFEDERGFFYESYNQNTFNEIIGEIIFVQDNLARSNYGVLRGLHIQLPPYSQSKLLYVLEGKIIDVAVDVRKNSPTFGQSFQVELSAENKKQLFIPKGFLHGYSVLSDTALVAYKCDGFYHKESESGIHPLDKTLNINWNIPDEKIQLSEKDRNAISFLELPEIIL